MSYPFPHLALLVALLAAASASDVARSLVPNAIVVAVASGGVAAQYLAHGPTGVASGALAAICVGALLWPGWSRRWVGGGDLKLAASAAVWLGTGLLPSYLTTSALCGGAVAVVSYAMSAPSGRADVRRNILAGVRGLPFGPAAVTDSGRAPVPASAAFAAGAVITLVTGGAQ